MSLDLAGSMSTDKSSKPPTTGTRPWSSVWRRETSMRSSTKRNHITLNTHRHVLTPSTCSRKRLVAATVSLTCSTFHQISVVVCTCVNTIIYTHNIYIYIYIYICNIKYYLYNIIIIYIYLFIFYIIYSD